MASSRRRRCSSARSTESMRLLGSKSGHGAQGIAVGEGEEAVVPVLAVVAGFGGRCRVSGEAEAESQLLRALVGAPDGADREAGDTDTGDAPEGRHGSGAAGALGGAGQVGWCAGGERETIPNKHRKSRKATVVAGWGTALMQGA